MVKTGHFVELIRREKILLVSSLKLIIDVIRKLLIVHRIVNGEPIPQPKAYFNRLNSKKEKKTVSIKPVLKRKISATNPFKKESL